MRLVPSRWQRPPRALPAARAPRAVPAAAPSAVVAAVVAVVAVLVLASGAAIAPPARAVESTGSGAAGQAAPSGLAWHSGVFSHDAQQTVEFERARGREVDVLAVFPTRDSWETILQDWWMSPTAVPQGFRGTLAVGVPLFPGGGSLEQTASGADDARWEELGRLIASRYPDAWVRPGWEMNIPNWPWAATPDNVETYRAAFRTAVTALRRGGPGLRIVFNPNEGRGGSLPDATQAYPGDDVVDVVGIDAYDWYPAYQGDGWPEHRTKDQGWDFWADFARSRGKKFAVPEWGVMTGSDASGGDNPDYIASVMAWMGEHADLMAFDAYFEETQSYCQCALSQNPRAAAAYTATLADLATLPAPVAAPWQPGAVPAPPGAMPSQPGAVPSPSGAVPPPSDAVPPQWGAAAAGEGDADVSGR